MSEHDVPAERGRGELREKLRHLTRDPGPLGSAVCALLKAAEAGFPVMVMPDESRAILDLLAPQGAPQTHEVAAESPSRGPDGSEVGSGLSRDCRAIAAPHEAPPILSRKHANEIAYFLRRPDMAHDAKRERLASLVERAGAVPQEAPICLQCIERAEQEIAAGHYYRADELMTALRERREPVCACGETHPDRTPLAAARPAPDAREPELLGYVVERQLTTGEWVRVWRGSTLWFDHDEAVLDRDAYALDGIPAHIRPVYLGAPAPADSATSEEGAGDAE